MSYSHQPVLTAEVIAALNPQPGKRFFDATIGLGGHARLIAERIVPGGYILGVDRDREALTAAARALDCGKAVRLVYGEFKALLAGDLLAGEAPFDGALIDLGISSFQLDDPARGFSFMHDGPLDMRMDRSSGATAAELVNAESAAELGRWLRDYGEERWWPRIVAAIIRNREQAAITTTRQLADIVSAAIPRAQWPHRIHPATRTFQALRIAVNNELEGLTEALERIIHALNHLGTLVVISFHSLEDRIVKRSFQLGSSECVCAPKLPECRCGHVRLGFLPFRKPLQASAAEIEANPRARSARLRAFTRLIPER